MPNSLAHEPAGLFLTWTERRSQRRAAFRGRRKAANGVAGSGAAFSSLFAPPPAVAVAAPSDLGDTVAFTKTPPTTATPALAPQASPKMRAARAPPRPAASAALLAAALVCMPVARASASAEAAAAGEYVGFSGSVRALLVSRATSVGFEVIPPSWIISSSRRRRQGSVSTRSSTSTGSRSDGGRGSSSTLCGEDVAGCPSSSPVNARGLLLLGGSVRPSQPQQTQPRERAQQVLKQDRAHKWHPQIARMIPVSRGKPKNVAGTLQGTVRLRGGGRPWFTGYEDTTEGGNSSDEGETSGYDNGPSSEGLDLTESSDDGCTSKGGLAEKKDGDSADNDQEIGGKRRGKATDRDAREGKNVGDEASATPTSRASLQDVYARTIARRRAMALAFRVIQRALMRAAFLVAIFQILPWLKHNFIAQCLLIGSLILQTVTELVAIARSADTSGKQGKSGSGKEGEADGPRQGAGQGSSSSSSPSSSSSSAGLIGGLMKAFSPDSEHRQNFDFHRMNNMFDKDVEALAAAAKPKLDVASVLASGEGEGSGLFGAGMMMKAFKGLAGSKEEGKGGATSSGSKKQEEKPQKGEKHTWGVLSNRKDRGRGTPDKEAASKGKTGRSKEPNGGDAGGKEYAGATNATEDGGGSDKELGTKEDGEEASCERDGTAHLATATGSRSGKNVTIEVAEVGKCSFSDHGQVNTENFNLKNTGFYDAKKAEQERSPATGGREAATRSAGAGAKEVQGAGPPQHSTAASDEPQKRVFVVSFRPGNSAEEGEEQQMQLLSSAVSFLVANGNSTTDEVVLLLESGGGEVTAFGLAAAKLTRLKDNGFKLTVCVDKVAASGGYMMACVAHKLIVAPFAMLGSIGVVGGITNFNKILKKNGVDYFHFTAGQHKSLVGPFQEVTKANVAMQQKQVDAIHKAFKRHVHRHRPSVDVEAVGTGEVWLGEQAVELRLADEVGTAMEYIQGRMANASVFLVKPHSKKVSGGHGILRALLLGPLATAARLATSLSSLSEAIRQMQRNIAGGGRGYHGPPSYFRSGGGGDDDALARALLDTKGRSSGGGWGGTEQPRYGGGAARGIPPRFSPHGGLGSVWDGGGDIEHSESGREQTAAWGGFHEMF